MVFCLQLCPNPFLHMQMERITGIFSNVVIECGYLCAAGVSEVMVLLVVESIQGLVAAEEEDGFTFTCHFSFCAL